MSRGRGFVLASLLVVAAACPAVAGIIFDNGGPTGVSGPGWWVSDLAPPGAQQIAAPFAIPSPAVVRGVQWWGGYLPTNSPPPLDDWTLRFFTFILQSNPPFYSFAAGDVGRTEVGRRNVGGEDLVIYEYHASIPDVALSGGTDYFFSVVANTVDSVDNWVWITTTRDPNSPFAYSYFRLPDQDWWANLIGVYAFNLTGDPATSVPEPATLSLLALGGLGMLRRRRKT